MSIQPSSIQHPVAARLAARLPFFFGWVIIVVAFLAFAFWFRRGNTKATYLPDWEYSGAVEMVVWGIPIMTIMLLGGITWIGSHDLEPSKPLVSDKPALNVEVVSLDWKWLFIYPEQGIATVNKIVFPAHTPINFKITTKEDLRFAAHALKALPKPKGFSAMNPFAGDDMWR